MENVNQSTSTTTAGTTTTTTAGTSTTTTTAGTTYQGGGFGPVPVTTKAPKAEQPPQTEEKKSAENFGDKVDMTSITRGKKINPRTGTQTSEDDPKGVWADNVHNEIQIEHAGHTQTQSTPGAGEMLADTIQKTSGNDGNKTPVQSKPLTAHQTQNDDARVRTTKNEEVQEDHKIQQGETGAENREDLKDLHGGGSGSNVTPIP